jgi:pantoate--beta-alanine ligase
MDVIVEIPALRERLKEEHPARQIAFVPTMGALHEGHRACVDVASRVDNASVVVSIFVNPTQFGPDEDLERYPRDLGRDLEFCEAWGCDVVFTPSAVAMYPRVQRTWVDVTGITDCLCGRTRPGHFRGVTTVVSKLFNIVSPDVAVFGQKDAQQALVIREMVRALDMPVELRLARIEREDDGLAMSSRNARLSPHDRRRAGHLRASLLQAARVLEDGERESRAVEAATRMHLERHETGEVDYVELRTASDLSTLGRVEGKVILAVAVIVGNTRLIDNMVFDVGADRVAADVDLF